MKLSQVKTARAHIVSENLEQRNQVIAILEQDRMAKITPFISDDELVVSIYGNGNEYETHSKKIGTGFTEVSATDFLKANQL